MIQRWLNIWPVPCWRWRAPGISTNTACCLRTHITHRTTRAGVSNKRLFSSERNIHANGKVKLHFLFFIPVNRHGLVFISTAVTSTCVFFIYRERMSCLVVTPRNNSKCQSCRSVVSSSLLNQLFVHLCSMVFNGIGLLTASLLKNKPWINCQHLCWPQ